MTSDPHGGIHDEHPFATPAEMRDPARRLRGRLAAPVTIITSGSGDRQTGLTVSSLVVAEGDPPIAYCLVGPDTDLFEAIETTGRFVVHVCGQSHRTASDVFAGLRPSPGGPFSGHSVVATPYGPRLAGFGTYAFCSLLDTREESYSALVRATIDEISTDEMDDPLLYFRGRYRRFGE